MTHEVHRREFAEEDAVYLRLYKDTRGQWAPGSLGRKYGGLHQNREAEPKPKYCIIGVPVSLHDETIKLGTVCKSATRVVKIGRSKVASSVVILSFQNNVPVRVKICLYRLILALR